MMTIEGHVSIIRGLSDEYITATYIPGGST